MEANERELLKGLTPAEARFILNFNALPASTQAEILAEYAAGRDDLQKGDSKRVHDPAGAAELAKAAYQSRRSLSLQEAVEMGLLK